LLSDAIALRLVAWTVDDMTAQITLLVRATPTSMPCPLCTTPAHRIHSHYERTLVDLPLMCLCYECSGRTGLIRGGSRAPHARVLAGTAPTALSLYTGSALWEDAW
jgi:hypothetical protein